MTIGQRLRRAMDKAGLTQKQVADLTGLREQTVGKIVRGETDPLHSTVERIVGVIGATYGEIYDEARISLSARDRETLERTIELSQTLLSNDAAQKALRQAAVPRRQPEPARKPDVIRDPGPNELIELTNYQIPDEYVREHARQAFKVMTDSMIDDGILEGQIVHVRWIVDVGAADGAIVVCRLNGALKIKRLDLRGGTTTLVSANRHYAAINVVGHDTLVVIGVVVTAAK